MQIRGLNRNMRRSAGAQLSLQQQAIAVMRKYGMALIGPAANVLGDGAPNLLSAPEFAGGLTDRSSGGGLTTASTLTGYDGAIAFGYDGSTASWTYKSSAHTNGLAYTFSVIVSMTDGLAPAVGNGVAGSSANSFAFVIGGDTVGITHSVSLLPDGNYRVSGTWVSNAGINNFGVVKYSSNDNRTFKVTGYKLELGSTATAYTPQSVLRTRGSYTDSTGTTPATTGGNVLGLVLDRSYGGAVGAELMTDPSFDDSSKWTPGAGWSVTGGNAVATAAGAGTNMVAAGAGYSATVANKSYKAEVTIASISGGVQLIIWNGSTNIANTVTLTTPGTYQIIYTANNAQCRPYLSAQGASTTLAASSLSQKEVLGSHATQPKTASSKPTLTRVPKRLGPNRVVNGTFDTDTTGWTSAGGVHAWSAGTLRRTTGQGDAGSYQDVTGFVAGNTYRLSAGFSNVTLPAGAAVSAYVGPSFGTLIGSVLASTGAPLTFVATSTTVRIYLYCSSTSACDFDNIFAQEVLEWWPAMNFGGDDSLILNGLFTGNEGWIGAAVTATDSNSTVICTGAGSNAQKGVWMYRTAADDRLNFLVGNGVLVQSTSGGLGMMPPNAPVFVEGWWTATQQQLGANGVYSTVQSRSGDAGPSPAPVRIGAYTDGATYPLIGSMTYTVISPVVPTAPDRALVGRWIRSLLGESV